eukprot:3446673-Rhodomonas_salina.1
MPNAAIGRCAWQGPRLSLSRGLDVVGHHGVSNPEALPKQALDDGSDGPSLPASALPQCCTRPR